MASDPSCPSATYTTGHVNTWPCSPWSPWRCRFLYENAARLIPSGTSELTDEVPSSPQGCSACSDHVTGPLPNPTRTCFYRKVSHVSTGAGNNTAAVVWKLHTNSKSRALVPPVQLRNPWHWRQRHTAGGGDQGLSEAPLPRAHMLHWQTCFLDLEPRALSLFQAAN